MPNPFAITAPTNTILLQAERRGEASFTVSNISGRLLRGRPLLISENSVAEPWLQIRGVAERDFPTAGTEQYSVQIAVPADAPAGSYVFRLDMVGVENPDELYSQGPSVTFQVPAVVPRPKRFPWLILAIAGAVIVLGVLAFVLWPRNVAIPTVRGMSVSEAIAALNGARLQLSRVDEVPDDTVPSGQVVRSEPPEDTPIRRGSDVVLLVSTGPANAEVPQVAGLATADAKLKIVQAGLAVGTTTQEFSTLEAGKILRADPAEGQLVARGSPVNLVESKGQAPLKTISVVADADTYWDPNGTLYIVGQVPDFGHGRRLVLWNGASAGTGKELILRPRGPGLVVLHFPLDAIPAGAGIEKATLGMNLEDQKEGNLRVTVQRVISRWSEDDRTKPSVQSAGQVVRVVSPAAVPTWIEWDVTALVRNMAADPSQNSGLALTLSGAVSGASGSRTFTSREGTAPQFRPRLEISYR